MVSEPIVQFKGISKRFPGVQALRDVSFDVARRSCHALCGENGAGKSTLGRILAGIFAPDEGELVVDGKRLHFANPRDAMAAGIGIVHQELAFCENLTVAENLCLGQLPAQATFVCRHEMIRRAEMVRGSTRRDGSATCRSASSSSSRSRRRSHTVPGS